MTQKIENIKNNLKIQKKKNKTKNDDSILQYFNEFSISYESMKNAYLELFVPHPGIETKEKAEILFKNEFYFSINDPNLCLLIYSGILLEKKGTQGKLPFINASDYEDDLSFLIVDEIIGESIAEYIGGYKGRFEFVRFDKIKPGILSSLGPFIDDVVAGLLGGISANIYSRSNFKANEDDS